MKKYLLLIIGIFLFTGCDIEYNLELGYPIKEKTSIIETNQNNWNAIVDGSGETYMDLMNTALEYPFPILYSLSEYEQYKEKVSGIPYYSVSKLNTDSQIGLLLNGKFREHFDESNVAWYGLETFEFNDNEDSIYLYCDGFKTFETYEILNNINVNIKTDYEVTDSNADKITGNVYTWNINKNNYNIKSIYIKANKTKIAKVKKSVNDKVENISNKGLILTALILITVLIVVYFYYKKKENNNKF